jgi:hypothetical protein
MLFEVNHACLLLFRRQRRFVVIDSKLLERSIQVDLAVRHRDAEQGAQETFADGVDVKLRCGFTPLRNDHSVVDDNHRGCVRGVGMTGECELGRAKSTPEVNLDMGNLNLSYS